MSSMPSVFVSHGSPMILVEDRPSAAFLRRLGDVIPKPRAIVAVSAHWMTRRPAVTTGTRPETIHDFGGFPEALYRMRYPAPGAPDLAASVVDLLRSAGVEVDGDDSRGFDHGTWAPLRLAYPDADIPVVALSVQPRQSAAHHFRVGQSLASLRKDGVLILGSGAATHNLRAFLSGIGAGGVAPDWVEAFARWLRSAVVEGRVDDLTAYLETAPHALNNHPTPEHILPLFVALGAATPGTPGTPGTILHQGLKDGVMAMDAYRFD